MDTVAMDVKDQLVDKVVSEKVDGYLRKILPDGLIEKLKAKISATDSINEPLSNDQRFALALRIWRNNGWLDRSHQMRYNRMDRSDKRIKVPDLIKMINDSAKSQRSLINEATKGAGLNDYLMPTDASILLPQVVTTVVKEATEPLLVLTSLLRRIQFSGEQIVFPAVGAMTAEDMAPGQEYPERSLDWAGQTVAKIGKVGIAVKFTDEMLRYAQYDVMSMHLQAAGRALARHKEKKVADLITSLGVDIFDNDAPNSALHGATTGRNANGIGNGSLTLQDLFTMFADLMNAGFIPNTLLMNPMGWLIFAQNETLRAFGFANNGPLWGAIQGQPGQAPVYGNGGVNMYKANNPAPSATPAEQANATLMSPVPTLFPAPLGIVVSPFIGFNATDQSTDVIMCDRNELGILIEDEPVTTESWEDPSKDMMKVKMRERYSLAIDNEGQSIAVARGVRLAKGYDWDDFVVTKDIAVTGLPAITGF